MVTKLTKHVNQRDIYERRRILEPSQKILLYDVLATNLRGLLFDVPQKRLTFAEANADIATEQLFVSMVLEF